MAKYIPISQSLIQAYPKDLFYYLYLISETTKSQSFNFDGDLASVYVINYLALESRDRLLAGQKLGVYSRTWKDFLKQVPETNLIIKGEGIAMLPQVIFTVVWEKMHDDGYTWSALNSAFRVFAYLYLKCSIRNSVERGLFQISQAMMAEDLGMTRQNLSRILNNLREFGFVERVGKFKFGSGGFSYQYRIPAELRSDFLK